MKPYFAVLSFKESKSCFLCPIKNWKAYGNELGEILHKELHEPDEEIACWSENWFKEINHQSAAI